MAQTSRRTSRRPVARSATARARSRSMRSRSRGQTVKIIVGQATGTITVGTARQTDLFAACEAQIASGLEGALLTRGVLRYVARPVATGTSEMGTAFLRGPDSLDVGDLLPLTDQAQPWLNWQSHKTYGNRYLVATTPILEFYEHRWNHRVGPLRNRTQNDALWFVEQSIGQNWEAMWLAQLWWDVS